MTTRSSREDVILAGAQIALSVIYTAGYFCVLGAFLLGFVRTPPDWKDALQTLIGLLTAGELLILQFWFSRSRGTAAGSTPTSAGG